MWVVAGVLLGLVVLAALMGFHAGPHVHAAAGVLGVAAAGWLVYMVVSGRSLTVLGVLLSADLVVCVGVAVLAWRGLSTRGLVVPGHRFLSPMAAEGVAVGDLDPQGIVRVHGENWSAVSVNGTVPAGGRVQVIGGTGVRLEVWGEEPESDGTGVHAPPAVDSHSALDTHSAVEFHNEANSERHPSW
jgi:hypothetical protein